MTRRVPRAVVVLDAVLIGLAVALWAILPPLPLSAPNGYALALLFAAVFLSEWFPLTLEHRGETMHMTVSGVLTVLGVLTAGPAAALIARVAGGAAGMGLRWRNPPEKLAFNAGSFAIETWVVTAVLAALAPAGQQGGPSLWGAIILSMVAADVATYGCVLVAMRCAAGRIRRDALSGMAVGIAYSTGLSASLAVFGAIVLAEGPVAALALVGVFLTLVTTNRTRHAMAERLRSLSSLYAFMDAVHTTPRSQNVVANILREAERSVGARSANLYLTSGPVGVRHVLDGEEVRTEGGISPVAIRRLAARAVDGMVLAAADARPEPGLLGATGPQAVIASFLYDGVAGVVVLEDRRGNLPTFDDTDRRLVVGLIRHAGSAVLTAQLVEDLRARSDELRHLALNDRATGLPNLEGLLARQATSHAVAIIEIVDLDELESSFGRQSADHITSSLAERLRGVRIDTVSEVARISHDRYAMTFSTSEAVRIRAASRAVQNLLQAAIPETGVRLRVRTRVGIATSAAEPSDTDGLLRAAGSALVRTRGVGSADTFWFDPSIDAEATTRILLASDLTDAIASDDIAVVYQPKVSLVTGDIVGVEALARWTHPDGEQIGPDRFIDLAERTGLIGELTRGVTGRAVAQARLWRLAGHEIDVAVNFSADCLRDATVVTEMLRQIHEAGLSPTMFTVEITESLMLTSSRRGRHAIQVLADAGVHISLDDFGTGYSSLAQLNDLPVDQVKIDRAFITGLGTDPSKGVITGTIVQMAASLGLDVVAEGVEDDITVDALLRLGCPVAQGYHLGRPMSATDVTARMDAAMRAPVRAAARPDGHETVVPIRRTGSS